MSFLNNLYHRTLIPGDLPARRSAGIVQMKTENPAVYGMRVQIPRRARRLIPYALDIEAGIDDRKGGYLPPPGTTPPDWYPEPPPPPYSPPPPYGGGPPPSGVPPQEQPPGVPPGGTQPPPGGSCCPPPGTTWNGNPWPAAPGYKRTFNFQFTADTAGSDPTFEIRLSPPIGHPFRIVQVEITPLAAITVGQYLDILILPNADMQDAGAFLGASVFENLALLEQIPAPDNTRALAIPVTTARFTNLGPIWAAGQQIKCIAFFVTPAVNMPQLAVTVVAEELEDTITLPPPREPPTNQPPQPSPPPPFPPPPPPPPPPAVPVVFLTDRPSYDPNFSQLKGWDAYQSNGTWYVTRILVGATPEPDPHFSYPPPLFDWPDRFRQALAANLVNILPAGPQLP